MLRKPNDDAEFLYPDHLAETLDIVGREYDLAASSVRSNSITLGLLSAIYAISASAAGLLGLTNPSDLHNARLQLSEAPDYYFFAVIATIIATAYAVTESLARTRFNFVISARKIVIIRQLTNIQFGRNDLILPSARYEAAVHPYAIRMFEGWRLRFLYPLLFSLFALGALLALLIRAKTENLELISIAYAGFVLLFVVYYRSRLFDRDENWLLLGTAFIARLLNVKIDRRFSYLLYRARLSVQESQRLGVNFSRLKPILIFREDRTFQSNIGISIRGMARALLQSLIHKKRQGGSSISQQLFRTIFIIDYNKTIRRKFIEIAGAFWLKSTLNNDDLLDLYICSVRYGPSSYGLMAAMKHFKVEEKKLNPIDSFVLVERVSNIGTTVRWNAIENSLSDAVNNSVLTEAEKSHIVQKYKDLLSSGILTPEQA